MSARDAFHTDLVHPKLPFPPLVGFTPTKKQWRRWLPLVLFIVASLPFLLRGHHQDYSMRRSGDSPIEVRWAAGRRVLAPWTPNRSTTATRTLVFPRPPLLSESLMLLSSHAPPNEAGCSGAWRPTNKETTPPSTVVRLTPDSSRSHLPPGLLPLPPFHLSLPPFRSFRDGARLQVSFGGATPEDLKADIVDASDQEEASVPSGDGGDGDESMRDASTENVPDPLALNLGADESADVQEQEELGTGSGSGGGSGSGSEGESIASSSTTSATSSALGGISGVHGSKGSHGSVHGHVGKGGKGGGHSGHTSLLPLPSPPPHSPSPPPVAQNAKATTKCRGGKCLHKVKLPHDSDDEGHKVRLAHDPDDEGSDDGGGASRLARRSSPPPLPSPPPPVRLVPSQPNSIDPSDYPRWHGMLDALRQPDSSAVRPELRRRIARELRPLHDMATGRCMSDHVAPRLVVSAADRRYLNGVWSMLELLDWKARITVGGVRKGGAWGVMGCRA